MTDRTDLEHRLTAALDRGAEQAPGADGLAGAARGRARARRRRAVTLGAVAVVLVVAAGGVAVSWPGDDGPGPSATDAAWRTVEVDLARPVLIDVPADWVELADCGPGATGYGPDGAESCTEGEGMVVVAEADGAPRPGVRPTDGDPGGGPGTDWTGNVGLDVRGFGYVNVRDDDEQRVLQVLGSVRSPGQEAPETGAAWSLVEADGVAYRVPPDADGIELTLTTVVDAEDGFESRASATGWRASSDLAGVDRRIDVTAPTRALAEVVAGSARRAEGADVGWTTLTVRDVDVDVPGDWDLVDTSGCEFQVVAFGPPGTGSCIATHPLEVSDSSSFGADPVGLASTNAGWGGIVVTGDSVVTVDVEDRDDARRVLASVRPTGQPLPDLDDWTVDEVDDPNPGSDLRITADMPSGAGVEVVVSNGIPDCSRDRGPAGPRRDGRWAAGLCHDRIVTVVAPTQALADVVASTVRGY